MAQSRTLPEEEDDDGGDEEEEGEVKPPQEGAEPGGEEAARDLQAHCRVFSFLFVCGGVYGSYG